MTVFNFTGHQRKHTKTVKLSKGQWQHCNHIHCSKLQGLLPPSATCVRWNMDEDDPIINMETHLIPDDENEDFEEQVHQPEAPDAQLRKGWIGASLQINQSHLTLMQTDRTDLPVIIEDRRGCCYSRETSCRVPSLASQVESHVGCQNAKHGQAQIDPKEVGKMPRFQLAQAACMEKPPGDHGEPSQRLVSKVESFAQPQSRDNASASISWSPVNSRAHCPNQGLAHQQELQGGNSICGSLQWFGLHPPSEVNQCRGNS